MLNLHLPHITWPLGLAKKCGLFSVVVFAFAAIVTLDQDTFSTDIKPATPTIYSASISNLIAEPYEQTPHPPWTENYQLDKTDLDQRELGKERPLINAFHALLTARDYESVIDTYDQIYTDSSIDVSAKYRNLLLNHASDLIQGNDLSLPIALLNQYLAIYYKDVDALILLGQAYREAELKFEAIQSLQQAYQYEHRTSLSELILSLANTVLGEYVQELKEADEQQNIIDVYRWLTQSQPDVSGYFIGLAKAYTAQQRYGKAADALRYVQYDIKVGQQARSLLKELAEKNNA